MLQLLVETLTRFFEFLCRWRKSEPAQANSQAPAAKRAMLCIGLLCRYFDFDDPAAAVHYVDMDDGTHVLAGVNINEQVFQLLISIIDKSASIDCALYAFKGLGQMCVCKPERISNCRAIFKSSLQPSANFKRKPTILEL